MAKFICRLENGADHLLKTPSSDTSASWTIPALKVVAEVVGAARESTGTSAAVDLHRPGTTRKDGSAAV